MAEEMPGGVEGASWTSNSGVVEIDGLERDVYLDGINETGPSIGSFYLPNMLIMSRRLQASPSHQVT
ncbi:MAG: hypothetical protein AAF922_12265 [Pseudomonadota bacterium]